MPDRTYYVGRVGYVTAGDGAEVPLRQGKTGELIQTDGHGKYHEPTRTQNVYSLTLPITATGIAAGNLVGAAAAAAVQFALWNPPNSGKLLSLLKFGMGIVSGTPVGGPLFHGVLATAPTILSVSTNGTPINNYVGGNTPTARWVAVGAQAGTALTGATAVALLRATAFTSTATAQASPGMVNSLEELGGDIILPPGTGWVPLWATAGTSVLNAYSITWEEVNA